MDEIRFLHRQADECRRFANGIADPQARRALQQLASHYECEARQLNLAEMKSQRF